MWVHYGPVVPSDEFVPSGFDPPTSLVTERFRLEPLGPQHNQADHAAWMSSIEHIRSTPGYPDGNWPPATGMTLERNLADLQRHADDFTRRVGFTFTVLDPGDDDVIGCVYVYPSSSKEWDVTVQSWVRADRSDLDGPLAEAVAQSQRFGFRCGRSGEDQLSTGDRVDAAEDPHLEPHAALTDAGQIGRLALSAGHGPAR